MENDGERGSIGGQQDDLTDTTVESFGGYEELSDLPSLSHLQTSFGSSVITFVGTFFQLLLVSLTKHCANRLQRTCLLVVRSLLD